MSGGWLGKSCLQIMLPMAWLSRSADLAPACDSADPPWLSKPLLQAVLFIPWRGMASACPRAGHTVA